MFVLALGWSLNWAIIHTDLPGTVLVMLVLRVIINCPTSFANCPGVDSKLCGHSKGGLSWSKIKPKKAGEASRKSVALTQPRHLK